MEPPPQPTPSRPLTFSIPSPTSHTSRSRVRRPPGNKPIAITKVKIIILYKACKCDSSIAIGVCRVVTLACMRELQNQYGIWNSSSTARGSILKRCQEPHFSYCIWYSLQICRAYRYGGAPYSKVIRSAEQQPHIQIWAPDRLYYGASIFNMKL